MPSVPSPAQPATPSSLAPPAPSALTSPAPAAAPRINASAPQQPAARRRGGVACRRCRRLRSKCINHQAQPPCDACRAAGPEAVASCSFPARGQKDTDRDFRRRPPRPPAGDGVNASPAASSIAASHSRQRSLPGRAESPSSPSTSTNRSTLAASLPAQFNGAPSLLPASPSAAAVQYGDSFPPYEEVVEGCRTFINSYFQLGFLPKAVFLESLVRSPESTSRFLLACILSISSRFTPCLVHRYGSPAAATDFFLAAARAMASVEMYRPSLDRTQAFFLLAIAGWGNGDRDRSSIDMGVAVRMAALLRLHREETYTLPPDASADRVVRAESARRTFWMIQSQENLHSGYTTPAPFSLEDITARLPCDEADFAFGIVPPERAALAGTSPALRNPGLATGPNRCLFATLIQAHNLWGQVARCAGLPDAGLGEATPWEADSKFSSLTASLRAWEEGVPARHKWSVWNLRGWRAESLHLAYLSVVMVLRLSNIVIRRIYLERIISALSPPPPSSHTPSGAPSPYQAAAAAGGPPDPAPEGFWRHVSYALFDNVLELHEQVDAYFSMRTRDEGFPAILVFCVYMCGSLASYLGRHPQLCPHIAPAEAQDMAASSLRVLSELHPAWPTSAKWQKGLQHIARPLSGAEQLPDGERANGGGAPACIVTMQDDGGGRGAPAPGAAEAVGEDAWDDAHRRTSQDAVFAPLHPSSNAHGVFPQIEAFLDDHFSAELAAFLGGDPQYGLLDDWTQMTV
ncbi:N-carbamoylsarcosine amidase [Pleurostoma richardsiae]|uniref:N-carbamoylsarcosine amidase n=1 Tax=Pleurostoma richardsiae TaxID=41990 RepID=A0AA38RJY0_9PEZI|nr:N-carbamoylsarcosine amidase [Pleurostoma richardsiae]